ncbi:MAG TPA: methylamine utilization protein [Caulobacteraceae bacterium]|nr:methylamine utilization protein [Caulobacteraceae bacterium]
MMRRLAALVLALMLPVAAHAGDLVVSVRTPQGRPVADAVVTLPGRAGGVKFAWPYRMAQQNLQFDPFVLIVPVGAEVAFPNLDRLRHHVYSFSPAHPFELKLYGRDETRIVRFDKAGIIALGCNIHDSMVAFIDVVDTPYAAKTDAAGEAVIHNAPAGATTVKVWHPYLKGAGNAVSVAAVAPREGTGRVSVTADLRAPPDRRRLY